MDAAKGAGGQRDVRWVDLGTFIRDQRHLGQLSLRRLSELSGISNPYLSQIERGLRKPSADILQQLARALQISAESLYVQAGILDPGSPAPGLVEAIGADQHLTDEQKQALTRIYRSFLAENGAGNDPGAESDAEGAAGESPAVSGR